jgi:hypothetical protein
MFVGVTGHQDIPQVGVPLISNEITRTLRRFDSELTGVSSLAKGADQLFAEIALQVGGRLYVVVPCGDYESTFDDNESRLRFQRLLRVADKIETMNHAHPSEAAFLDAGKRVVDVSQCLIAVWDGLEPKGKGGTADIVRYAQNQGREVVIIWPSGTTR